MSKLYVITRRDLPDGAQAAQSCHGVSAFAVEYPELHKRWYDDDKNIVLVTVADEPALLELERRARAAGLSCSSFYEPDFNGQLTTIAVAGEGGERLMSGLPLTLRARKEAA